MFISLHPLYTHLLLPVDIDCTATLKRIRAGICVIAPADYILMDRVEINNLDDWDLKS